MTTKLPSTIGPTEINGSGIRTWGSDAAKFDVVSFFPAPADANASHSAAQPLRPAPILPITLIPEGSFIPQKYVIHRHSQRCLACGSTHEWTAAYAFNEINPTMMTLGKRVSHLVPITRFAYNVPVEVLAAPASEVPACHECARSGLNLSHLPKRPAPESLKTPLNPLAGKSPEPPKSERGGKKPKTIDDLLF